MDTCDNVYISMYVCEYVCPVGIENEADNIIKVSISHGKLSYYLVTVVLARLRSVQIV